MTQTIFPTISFNDARASIAFLERALGAEQVALYEDAEGRVQHAEVRIGQSTFMCGDARPGGGGTAPGQSVVYVVVDDADAAYERAREAGADPTAPVDLDYGSRDFSFSDPDGNRWSLGTYRGAVART